MIANAWIAMALGVALMAGGVTAASALGGNGDCTQDQVKEQLKDGSCEDCPDETLTLDGTCDSCNDYLYDWDYLYGEAGPHQSGV
jgi:hypothetical protein